MHFALLNTSIITADGDYQYRTITHTQALYEVDLARRCGHTVVSHIGHESTAAIMTDLLGFPVTMSRAPYSQNVGEDALVFKLNGRPPEGRILSREEIEAIGYTWALLRRTE